MNESKRRFDECCPAKGALPDSAQLINPAEKNEPGQLEIIKFK